MMSVKVFHNTTKLAMDKANEIAEAIRKGVRSIPLRNQDGTFTGEKISFSRVQVDPLDTGIAQVMLQWEVVSKFE